MSLVVRRVALVGVMLCACAAIASAQQQTSSTETKAFEVIAVDGNKLVVKLPEGTRELTVPESFRFTVDGQQLSVNELKPGMKGTAVITTRTSSYPVTVTEVRNGTVKQVTGSSIIVQTDEGFKAFTQADIDKRGIRIMRDGQPAQLSDLHAGDRLSATIITTKPPRVVTEKEVQATIARSASAPARPTAETAARPSASATTQAAAATTGSEAPVRKLPKTASSVPLIGLFALLSLGLGVALTIRRHLVE